MEPAAAGPVRPVTGVESSGWANIIALDTGGTTGWSIIMVHPDALSDPTVSVLENIEHWAHGEVNGDEDKQTFEIMELVEAWPDAAVVVEDFILRKYRKDRDLLAPVRMNAKIELALKIWPGLGGQRRPPLFTQPSSLALGTITDARLREWGLYERAGGAQHARDADRHALCFLRRAKHTQSLRMEAWPELFDEEEE